MDRSNGASDLPGNPAIRASVSALRQRNPSEPRAGGGADIRALWCTKAARWPYSMPSWIAESKGDAGRVCGHDGFSHDCRRHSIITVAGTTSPPGPAGVAAPIHSRGSGHCRRRSSSCSAMYSTSDTLSAAGQRGKTARWLPRRRRSCDVARCGSTTIRGRALVDLAEGDEWSGRVR